MAVIPVNIAGTPYEVRIEAGGLAAALLASSPAA
jgi:hypothetical protein